MTARAPAPPRYGDQGARLHGLAGDVVPLLGGQRGEQVHQRQRVVQVAQRVHKGRVPAASRSSEGDTRELRCEDILMQMTKSGNENGILKVHSDTDATSKAGEG